MTDVSLTYPDRDTPAVDAVTLQIRAGETVAFVGENGSGKSTLAALVAGLRTPTSGVVAWNGHPLATLVPEMLRPRITVVTQDFHRWPFTAAARGFLRDADLLIMDEPSSALDPRAEHALFQAIRDRHGVATTVLITHRLANVRHADVIYVLDHGRLVEAGSHDQLMARQGRYAELFALQAAGYRADPSGGGR